LPPTSKQHTLVFAGNEEPAAMLNNLSEQIRDCYAHAEECARKAAAQTDPGLKQDFLDMEKRWLSLAKSYELSERLDDFSDSQQTATSATRPTSRNDKT
jgi:hypothetical protein